MNQVKRISSTLNVFAANNIDPTRLVIGHPTPNNAEVTINGNLTVQGTTTTINSENTTLKDPILILNETGELAPGLKIGIVAKTGIDPNPESDPTDPPDPFPAIYWFADESRWKLSNDGINFYNISTQQGGSYLSAVVEDLNPELGGNLNVSTFSITSPTSVKIDAPLRLADVVSAPTAEPGYSIVYAAPTVGGGSGVFVASGAAANEELVSKKKAIIFSLIF